MRYLLLLVTLWLGGCAARGPVQAVPFSSWDYEMRDRDYRRMSAALRDCRPRMSPLEHSWLLDRFRPVEDALWALRMAEISQTLTDSQFRRFDAAWEEFRSILTVPPYGSCLLDLPGQAL